MEYQKIFTKDEKRKANAAVGAAQDRGMNERGRLIFETRKRIGMTQQGLAECAGVNISTVSRVEAGKMPGVSFDVMARLAQVLRLPLQDLVKHGWP